jgi:hypothetical protein
VPPHAVPVPPHAVPCNQDTFPHLGRVSLANSARTVVGTVLEETGFLVRPDGALFVVLHRSADRPPTLLPPGVDGYPPQPPADCGIGGRYNIGLPSTRALSSLLVAPCSDYFPENALLTIAAAGFGVPFSWNKP